MANFTEEFDKYNFVDRIKITRSVAEMQQKLNDDIIRLARDGCLYKSKYGAPNFGDGDFSIYNFYIQSYVTFVFEVLTIITNIISIIMLSKKKVKK